MVAEDIIVAVAVDVTVDYTFHIQSKMNPPGFPYDVFLSRIFVPESPLHEHPARADDVRPPVEVDVHCKLAVVVGFRAVGLGAVAVVGVFDPVGGLVPVSPRSNVEVAVAVDVQNRGAFTKRAEPVGVVGRIVDGTVNLDGDKNRLARLQVNRCHSQ